MPVHVKSALRALPLVATIVLGGCATVQTPLTGETLMIGQPGEFENTSDPDSTIQTSISSSLLNTAPGKANKVTVHCFQGQVFLVGEADTEFRKICLQEAHKPAGVKNVTTHWFPSGIAKTQEDSSLAESIESQLSTAAMTDPDDIIVDVWSGHVVLIGVLDDKDDVKKVIETVKNVKNVKSITNYLKTNA